MSEQDVLEFCNITGASPDEAETFLEIADNVLETAVTLYLENGGASTSRPTQSNNEQRLQDQVRAPIAAKTDILAGGGPAFHPSIIRSRREHIRPSVFNQGDSNTGSVDFLSRLPNGSTSRSSTGSPSESLETSAKAKRLADLFRPPFDIMFRGTFEQARETAKEKQKWLLVNIQDPTEFSCQILNRDLWSDAFVKDIIRESFIFLQYNDSSPDGLRYSNFYHVNKFPHIGIIDARTGERLLLWEKQVSPTDFMMEVTEFLEQNESESSRVVKRLKKSKNVSDMSEEEQLNAAIAASLNGSNCSDEPKSPIKETEAEPQPAEEDKEETQDDNDEEEEEEEKAGSAFDAIKPVKRDETTDIANSTRIQLRLGDGSRMIRRFLKTDPVRHIFEFVKAEVPGANDQPFELVFNRTQLIDVLDQTILEAGLSNAAVNCVFA